MNCRKRLAIRFYRRLDEVLEGVQFDNGSQFVRAVGNGAISAGVGRRQLHR
jgi:hypothetical protein